MPAVIVLAGPAGADKTAWMRKLAAELARRGRRVMVVSAPPPQPQPPPPSGVGAWLELGPEGYSLRGPAVQPPSLDELMVRHAAGMDLVLSEAPAEAGAHLVEWCPPGAAPVLLDHADLRAVVGEGAPPGGPAVFAPRQVAGLADLILGLAADPEPSTARILVDGRRLPAKEFVQDIVASAVRALVGSLKGGDKARRVELHLD
ncbi:MAG: hypothetical protein ACOZHQ_14805 [Thermodesulfobacteriota bacterium]